MAKTQTQFDSFLAEEIRQHRGIAVPVRTGLLVRLLVRKALCKKLHPNPDDEFCNPAIDPNNQIIQDYAEMFRRRDPAVINNPIQVVRIYPEGYMILNGHHRWAASLKVG